MAKKKTPVDAMIAEVGVWDDLEARGEQSK